MSNLKAKVSLLVVMLLVVSAFSVAFAADVNYIMNLSVSYNGKALSDREQVELYNSDTNRTLTVTTDAKYVDSSLTIYVTRSGQARQVLSTGKKSATFKIPSDLKEGYITDFAFEAVSNNTTNNYIGNSNGFHVLVVAPKQEEVTVTANLSYNGKTIAHGDTFRAKAGDKLTITGTSNIGVKCVSYKWDNGDVKTVNGSSTTITVPNLGEGKKLSIVAQATDGKWSNSKTFTILPAAEQDETTIEAYLKVDGVTKEHLSTITVKDSTKLVVEGVSNKTVSLVSYKWSNGDVVEVNGKSATIPVPSNIPAAGLTLGITAKSSDGKWANSKSFTIKKDSTTPVATTIEANLKVDGKSISNGATVTVTKDSTIVVSGTSNKTVKLVSYNWNGGTPVEVSGTSKTIAVPSNLTTSGMTLGISAQASDGTWSSAKYFTIKLAGTTPEATTIEANLKVDGKAISNGATVTVTKDSTIVVSGTSNKTVKLVSYNWNGGTPVEVSGTSKTIAVPSNLTTSGMKLGISAQASDGTWSSAKYFTIKLAGTTPEATTIEANLKVDGKAISNGATVTVTKDSTIVVSGTSNKTVKLVSYNWDGGTPVEISGTSTTVAVPSNLTTSGMRLGISAQATDGTWSSAKYFTIKLAGTTPEATTIDANLKVDGKVINEGATVTVTKDSTIVVYGTSNKTVKLVSYKWADGSIVEVDGSSKTIAVPSNLTTSGKKLGISAQATDGTWSSAKYYTIKLAKDSTPSDDDDELIVEPWMRENDELSKLAVSLRSEPYDVDEDEERANKNIYALGEKVIYYVDYKNGGKDIKKEVKLTLELPLACTVVDADGASVSKKDSKTTFTWTFPNGLEEDQSGTKEVIVKYTSLGSTKTTYKRITPMAEIYQETKKKDSSAVINLIIKDFDVEIKDEHDPYMIGDLGTDLFRPDDTITRAEGALVLTRIFGVSTAYDNNEYDFPDLNETYISARRAIRAARAVGLIEGFPDGNYYPNRTMTRGEFMTIIARQIEEEEGEGFEVKEADELIKIYKDKNKIYYLAENEQYDAHWAAGYATLLCRLNMAPVSEKNLNLRLDEPISRAEVAQLCNMFLLRAPAYVTKSTTTKFPDVSRKHPLFADIVEATRPSHTWSLNEDGEEVEE